ncbi:phage tail spike protein [Staphylococcus caprae]|uniref:phage tail spike protein n=1 Tax=Staphylococcus caprae TaxID=29380 RepID=UPI003B2173E4
MKNIGIHVLDFNDKIIDYISRDDGALIHAVMSNNAEEKSETFDFTVVNKRASKLRERNRIIAQDNNGIYREFVISHVVDNFDGTTDIESNASYLEDIDKSKPIKPGKYSAYSTSQALNETLRNTGWEISEDTEHGGMRTTSWTSYSTPYEVINMLCTTYDMVADYSIELGSHTVEHRYVTLKQPVSLFKGKEITKGKDLTEMTRTVDMSEVRTALYAIGPENDKGERISVVVKDDEAQAQFGLPGRYLWSVYEPESDDSSMTEERLTTLAQTELNKRNQSAISYEISSIDIHKHYPEMVVSMHDTVRIKDRDFRPPLYIEAEVIGVDYDLILDESTYKFGNVVEYDESSLRSVFDKKIDEIRKKLNDNVTNINTIVNDAIQGELEYYEPKIFKSDTEPDNPIEDMLWYDTSNPNVAVLKRYHNGEWLNETAKDVEQLGGMTREHVLYNSITNTFQNLNIQHSKLLEEVSSLLNNEYLVDNDIRNALNTAQDNLVGVYQQIKDNLDSMNEDTATIGKLIDTQALFLTYRERLQDLYRAMRDAQVSADKRLKLLQSQYTDEKFNDALSKVAEKFGLTIDSNSNMVGTPNVIEKAVLASREDTSEQLKSYIKSVDYETDKDGIVTRLDNADSERVQLSNLISDKVSLYNYKTDKDNIDKQLSEMSTSISQNGQDIQLRATKEEFDATNKTLSKTISDFTNNVSTGMTFTYDENGTIQSMNIGSDGIKLRGDKVDITVNKDFNVMASKVDDKVGKNEIINRLNLSPEGLDINVNNMGIRGGDNSEYIDIRNTSILSYGSFTRTWANVTDTANLALGINKGTIQVQNKTTGYNLYLTEKGLSTMLAGAGDETAGTLEFHSTKYNDTSRGVRLHSTYGAVALESDYSRIILNANLTVNIESNYGIYFRPYRDNRTGNNEFAMYVKQNDSGAYTDGVLKYGNVSSDTSQYGSGIRFSKSSVNSVIYATNKDGDIGTGDFYGNKIYGALTAKETNAYILADGALRITDTNGYNGGNTNYRDIQCQHIASNTIRTRVGKDFYIGVSSNELRVTNNLFWNGGDTGYKPIRASDYLPGSLERFKKDIIQWDGDALNEIVNNMTTYEYRLKDDEDDRKKRKGLVIGEAYKTPEDFIDGDGVSVYNMITYSLRAIQQLNEKIEKMEEQLNG